MSKTEQAVVTVSAAKTRPLRHIWSFVGYDEANYTYTELGRELLSKLATMGDAPYAVRCHFLLCSGDGTPSLKWGSSGVYDEDDDGNPRYSWTIMDKIFDTYVEVGCIPFVEIGFMPEALSTAPSEMQYATPKGGVGWSYPPREYDRWHDLIVEWARHLLKRYGIGEVQRWYWELWNEPDIGYWSGSIQEYCALFDHTEAALHSVIPQASLGGPGTTNPTRENAGEFLRRFLDHCVNGSNRLSSERGTRLDFISYHSKAGAFKIDPEKNKHAPTIANLLGHIDTGLSIAGRFPQLAGRPVHITECDTDGWAAGCMKDDPNFQHRNSEYYSSFIAMAACQILPLSTGANPVHSMLTWAFEFENRDYFEGFRTLSTNGVDKPSLNALRLLSRLGHTGVETDSSNPVVGVIGSTDDAGGMKVFLCAHHDDWDEHGQINVEVKISNLAPGRSFQITTTRIDHTHGNSYTEWKRLGEPQSPSESELGHIHAASAITPTIGDSFTSSVDGSAIFQIDLEFHAVCMVEIRAI